MCVLILYISSLPNDRFLGEICWAEDIYFFYSNPSIYVASINVVVKLFVPSNFNLCRHSIYVAFIWEPIAT